MESTSFFTVYDGGLVLCKSFNNLNFYLSGGPGVGLWALSYHRLPSLWRKQTNNFFNVLGASCLFETYNRNIRNKEKNTTLFCYRVKLAPTPF